MSVCLYFVVPCYDDAQTLPVTVPLMMQKITDLIASEIITESSRLLLVNDGSADNTWEVILKLKTEYPRITAVNLAQNTGEQNALLAGMFTAMGRADCVITMDSDLQDDIAAVDEMLQRYSEGCEIVYGVREKRKDDSAWERFTSGCFYTMMRLAGTGLIAQHSNYRLMSSKAIAALQEIEQGYYLPCAACTLSLKSAIVYHKRFARAAGVSHYGISKKLRLAMRALFLHSASLPKLLGVIAFVCAGLSAGLALQTGVLLYRQGCVPTGLWTALFFALLLTLISGGLCGIGARIKSKAATGAYGVQYTIKNMIE